MINTPVHISLTACENTPGDTLVYKEYLLTNYSEKLMAWVVPLCTNLLNYTTQLLQENDVRLLEDSL